MSNAWSLTANAPLQALNTFHVTAQAPWLLQIYTPEALPEALLAPQLSGATLLPLGSGSNVLFASDAPGVVLAFGNRSIDTLEHRADYAIVRAGAGTGWHELVVWSLGQGLSGLENLALIPGTVGAAPIQNIGAYGAQVEEFIHVVEAYDRADARFVRLDTAACEFGYRDSLFKRQPDRYLIVAVEFRLPRLHALRMDYAGIAEELEAMGITTPSAPDVAQAVINLRRRKLPDPEVLGNAGSFFKNPVLPLEQVQALQHAHPELPVFHSDDQMQRKLSAAWLIEACGWKGHRDGDAAVSATHALVLVNHGHASGTELLALARRISASVRERFGVILEPEPRIVGAQW
ncbi:UDP-N-acetylmuramate dehydrogenase [Xanthomonas albilineans]|uniref:UDP-N-acetylmuramate dehydrogenase n=1 Tax=Xanthomonas albilineans TaxID=29447 RepID=UPI0005F34FDC|nr:UDP-N-acetylmuramate dehydrogenase [Xanthomonas albilineans]PPU94871.1 UDP-N-acetylmuramate dehydrogenase [Xanthomonas albilineans]